jgi:signal transduction histidine kinase
MRHLARRLPLRQRPVVAPGAGAGEASQRVDPASDLFLAWPLALLVAVALIIVAIVFWIGSTREDQGQSEAEHRIVHARLDEMLQGLRRVATDNAWWNEAYRRLGADPDLVWADQNYGPYLFKVYGIDLVELRDATDRTFYAARAGGQVPGDPLRGMAGLAPLLARAEGDNVQGPRSEAVFLRDGDAVHAVGVAALLPEANAPTPVDASAAGRLILAQRLDSHLLTKLADSYGIAAPAILATAPVDFASVQLTGVDGAPVGVLAWKPGLPGAHLRAWMMPALLLAALVFLLFAWLCFRQMRTGAVALVEREEALRLLAERARNERFKTELVGTVSHELRTPLTAIRGALGLVLGGAAGPLPERAERLVEMAQRNAIRLVSLVNDILDIERLENEQITLVMRKVDLVELAQETVRVNEGMAAERRVELRLLVGIEHLPVPGDPERLQQVLTNLISNACKFSEPDGVVIVAIASRDGRAEFSVHDGGPGVPPAFREHIFQKFAQADSSDTRSKGGTGLGLSISRAIVTRHGGTITFTSTPGNTTFTVSLPLWPPSRTS